LWKDIIGYEGLYQLDVLGRIKSLGRFKQNHSKSQLVTERIMCPNTVGAGYLQVALSKNGKRKNHYIHRLVASHFIENPNLLPEVNHKNEIKTDNNKDNLEWCTRQYNAVYSLGKIKQPKVYKDRRKFGDSNSNATKVKCITTGEIFNCIVDASVKYSICRGGIVNCINGRAKSSGKHKDEVLLWEYVGNNKMRKEC